jgi:hypothetical protein
MRIGRWDITFAFSLFCSLLINSGMVGVVVLRAQPPRVVDLSSWQTRQLPTTSPAEVLLPPADLLEPPPPKKKIEFDNRDVFGEHQGTGEALNSSPGDQPLQSMKGPQVQAYLGRNPPSARGGGGGSPAMIGAASPAQAAAPKVTPPAPQAKLRQPQQTKPQNPQPPQANAPVADVRGNQPMLRPQTQPVNIAPQVSPQAAVSQVQPSVAASPAVNTPSMQGNRRPPGPPGQTADVAPPSDKDSDPFSDNNSFRFINGRVSARNGRIVKTVRPQLLQAGMLDAELMANPSVTFLATVDEQGNVIHVDRYRSSGSDNIDLPCEQALAQWWIEPSKDKSGKPTKDIVSVTFMFFDAPQ